MKSIVLVFAALFLFSCDDSEMLTQEDVQSIKYGTSFGMCVDYCLTDIEVDAQQIYYINYGWKNSVTPKAKNVEYTPSKFDHLLSLVDQEQFLSLDPVLGCPDCADGGAEWIEMKIGKRTKKVTFEYGKTIDEIKSVIEELRLLNQELSKD